MIHLRVSWIRRDMSCTGRQLFALMNIRRLFLARTANVLLQIILLTFKSSNNILSWQIMRDRFIDYEICQLRPVQLEKRITRPVWQVSSNSWHPWPGFILGLVVQRMISGNLGLNVYQGVFLSFFVQKHFLGYFSLFCITQSLNYRQEELNWLCFLRFYVWIQILHLPLIGYPNPASNNRAQGFSALISCYGNYSWVCCNCCKGVVWLVWEE